MDYEIVHLLERSLLVLPPVRLSNSDVNLSEKIGSMYHNFYERCSQIGCAVNGNPICVYSNYARDLKGNFDPSVGYDISIGCEVDSFVVKNGWVEMVIPAGKYAKFVITGNLVKQVPDSWAKICSMNLPRRFAYDFDEYQTKDVTNGQVHIYVSLS